MRVFLTGGSGMVGQSILRLSKKLQPKWEILAPTHQDLNLLSQTDVTTYLSKHSFDLVIHCAAKVGGIKANISDMSGFLIENNIINSNVINGAMIAKVPKLINLGSSCMYTKDYRNPLVEDDILAAPFEPTNEGYAIAKVSAAKLCSYISNQYGLAYRTFIPCNLYGEGDRFDVIKSHLISAIILKIHNAKVEKAKNVEIWGDGTVRREFMYVDDLAHFILNSVNALENFPNVLNTGSGIDYTVNEFYNFVAKTIGYNGAFTHNLSEPVGMKQKLMDSSKAKKFGWAPQTGIGEGIQKTYDYFLSSHV